MERTLTLVVDIDGTLLKSDMLYESFFNAFGRKWWIPFVALAKIVKGKAALKSYLSEESDIDATSLPYNDKVISYIEEYNIKEGQVVLVTAANQVLADKIAAHLKIFEEVHGSNQDINLKGPAKAKFLVKHFGEENFCYMGNAASDLSIWRLSGKIVTVNTSQSVCKQADALGKPIEHIRTVSKSWRPYVKALRPHQWLKNILIFLPMLAAHQFDSISFSSSLLAFVAFCLVASSSYILNDLLDLNADRIHPRKRLRPFASGAIPISHGCILLVLLLASGIALALFLGWIFLLALGSYYLLTVAYSLSLKSKIVIDICLLAGLYTIRLIAGGVATEIELSVWLLAFSIFFFLSLAAVKRQAELVDIVKRGESTAKGRGYHVEDLPIIAMIGLTAGYISVLVMALYINSPSMQNLYKFSHTLWGICCILLYWLTRLLLITHRGSMHDDPIVFAVKDKFSQICFVAILCLASVAVLF